MDLSTSGSSDAGSDSQISWIDWFHSQRGHEYFCQIDQDFILDRFNLAGLNIQTQNFQLSLQVITDSLEHEIEDRPWEVVDKHARHLYGLVHARWITTGTGLAQMVDKYRHKDFGKCPRVLCEDHPCLPVGLSDLPGVASVKLYCPNCEDIYNPIKKYNSLDGCYFTTTLPHLLLLMYPSLVPERNFAKYEPRVFGFRVHETAVIQRKQEEIKREMEKRISERRKLLKMEE